jgi:predicted ATPase
MIAGITGGKAFPDEIAAQIIDRTEGLPLFVEKSTKALVESGMLTDAGDHYTATGSVPSLAIPASLRTHMSAADPGRGELGPEGDDHQHPKRRDAIDDQVAQIEWLAARQPVLMLFDDAQWSDPTSLELYPTPPPRETRAIPRLHAPKGVKFRLVVLKITTPQSLYNSDPPPQ